jgi:hypothetical protein
MTMPSRGDLRALSRLAAPGWCGVLLLLAAGCSP